jgi:hypothetical protein
MGTLIWTVIFVVIFALALSRRNKYNDDNKKEISTEANTVETEVVDKLKIGGIEVETETEKLLDIIYEILIEEGFRPLLTDFNAIEFKIEGIDLRIQFYRDDEYYMKLGCWIYNYKQEDKNAALDTANRVNIYVKCVCIALYRTQIIAHSDILVSKCMDVKEVLFRHIHAVLYARDEFYRITNEWKFNLN